MFAAMCNAYVPEYTASARPFKEQFLLGTLDLVREAIAVLLRIIHQLTGDSVSLKDIGRPLALKALVMARSVLGEFASQNCNPSYEKY